MTKDSLDPRREKLIAALYGELSAEEEQAFRALLDEDEALRAEWEELREARAFLTAAEGEAAAPEFVFVTPTAGAPSAPVTEPARAVGFWERLRAAARMPATGFALAAVCLLVLVLSGLRVDRIDGRLAIGFGSGPPPDMSAAIAGGGATPMSAQGIPLEPGGAAGTPTPSESSVLQPAVATDTDAYVTHNEFVNYSNQVLRAMEGGFTDYDQRHRTEMLLMMRGLYNEMEKRDLREREALNDYIERMMLDLIRAGHNAAVLESLMQRGEPVELPSFAPTPNGDAGVTLGAGGE